jgi:hypothetical protein
VKVAIIPAMETLHTSNFIAKVLQQANEKFHKMIFESPDTCWIPLIKEYHSVIINVSASYDTTQFDPSLAFVGSSPSGLFKDYWQPLVPAQTWIEVTVAMYMYSCI